MEGLLNKITMLDERILYLENQISSLNPQSTTDNLCSLACKDKYDNLNERFDKFTRRNNIIIKGIMANCNDVLRIHCIVVNILAIFQVHFTQISDIHIVHKYPLVIKVSILSSHERTRILNSAYKLASDRITSHISISPDISLAQRRKRNERISIPNIIKGHCVNNIVLNDKKTTATQSQCLNVKENSSVNNKERLVLDILSDSMHLMGNAASPTIYCSSPMPNSILNISRLSFKGKSPSAVSKPTTPHKMDSLVSNVMLQNDSPCCSKNIVTKNALPLNLISPIKNADRTSNSKRVNLSQNVPCIPYSRPSRIKKVPDKLTYPSLLYNDHEIIASERQREKQKADKAVFLAKRQPVRKKT